MSGPTERRDGDGDALANDPYAERARDPWRVVRVLGVGCLLLAVALVLIVVGLCRGAAGSFGAA